MKILDLLRRGGKLLDGALAADIVEEPLVPRFLPRDMEAKAFALMVNRPLVFAVRMSTSA